MLALPGGARCILALILVVLSGQAVGSLLPALSRPALIATTDLRPDAPDLLIESASVRVAEECRPSQPLLYISATLYNRGAGPAFVQNWDSIVYARDTWTRDWGNGLKLPAIAGGGRQSVTFPIYFRDNEPADMAGTHRFVVSVATGGIRESSYRNNRFGPLEIDVPGELCRR